MRDTILDYCSDCDFELKSYVRQKYYEVNPMDNQPTKRNQSKDSCCNI